MHAGNSVYSISRLYLYDLEIKYVYKLNVFLLTIFEALADVKKHILETILQTLDIIRF